MLGNSGTIGIEWLGNARHRVIWVLVTVLLLLGLTTACGGERGNTAELSPAPGPASQAPSPAPTAGVAVPSQNGASVEAPPSNVPTVVPTAVSLPPTATPAPRVFAGPVTASNIPFPTYPTNTPRPLATRAPTPTKGPTPTARPEELIMAAARSRFVEFQGVAFEVTAILDFDSDNGIEQVSVGYTGNFRPGYIVADLAITRPSGTGEVREITANLGFRRITHIIDAKTDNREPYFGRPPYFVDLPKLFGLDDRSLGGLTLQGEINGDSVSYSVLNAEICDLEIGGGRGDVAAVFRTDRSDGFLKEVEATGTLEFAEDSAPLGDTGGKTATVKLAVRLFDYGKTVPIVTPELAQPLFDHQAILLDDGQVLIGSGSTGVANNDSIAPFPSVSVQVCDVVRRECTLLESPVKPGLLYSLVSLADGRALSVGLGGQDNSFGNINLFDPQTSSWKALPSAPRDRVLPILVLLKDGRVAVVGGMDFFGSSPRDVMQEVDIFDPTTQRWREAAPMNRAFLDTESGPLVFSLEDGRIMALGETKSDLGSRVTHAEVYDPISDTWRTVSGLDELYSVVAGAKLRDGTILVLGGAPLAEVEFLKEVGGQLSADEKRARIEARFPHARTYDPVTNAWAPAAGMQYPRSGATITALSDGRALVAGGTARISSPFQRGEGELVSFTEIYDPATNAWSPGPELQQPRSHHNAVALPDGRVLITGGIGIERGSGERYPLSSVEIIDPATAPVDSSQ